MSFITAHHAWRQIKISRKVCIIWTVLCLAARGRQWLIFHTCMFKCIRGYNSTLCFKLLALVSNGLIVGLFCYLLKIAHFSLWFEKSYFRIKLKRKEKKIIFMNLKPSLCIILFWWKSDILNISNYNVTYVTLELPLHSFMKLYLAFIYR